jgi:type I restriction enzyme S subunit
MEVRPGYKQTEVGMIPEEWNSKQIHDVCSLINGRGFKPHEWQNAGLPIIRIQNLNGSEDFNYYLGQYNPKILIEHGQLLFAWSGSRGTSFGPHVWRGGRALLNYHTWKVVVDESKADADFLLHALLQLTSFIEDRAHGASALVHTQKWEMEKFPIPIPATLPEQRAIATALNDVDALLGALDRLVVKKRDIKQGAMQQLLTGQTRLHGFHGEWEVKRLGNIGEISSAGVDKKIRPDEVPVRLVNYLNVYRKDFLYSDDLNHWVTATPQQAKRCAVQKGDVFFTPTSETRDDIGISAVAMEDIPDAAYSYHVARLRLHEPWDLGFRTYAFKTRAFLHQTEMLCDGNGTRYVISQDKFRSMTVHVPPVPEQTAIAAVLMDMDAELAVLEQRQAKTRALKQGMMQELLTGRTRIL